MRLRQIPQTNCFIKKLKICVIKDKIDPKNYRRHSFGFGLQIHSRFISNKLEEFEEVNRVILDAGIFPKRPLHTCCDLVQLIHKDVNRSHFI